MIRIIAIILYLFTITVSGDTIVADSLSHEDVQAAMDSAEAGDIVQLPAGTGNWTSAVSWNIPANVTLKGAGTSVTGGGDQTIIVDDFNSTSPLLNMTVSATGTFRMTGITFRTNDNDPVKENGEIIISGPGSGVSGAVRVDHCHFDNHTNAGATNANIVKLLYFVGDLTGVLDSCIIDANGVSAIYTGNKAGASGRGDETWAEVTEFGSDDFFFFEDNIYRANTAGPIRTGDTFSGGKVVLRFNTIIGGAGQEEHATGASGDGRGARAVESYGNSFEVLDGQAFPPRCIANKQAGTSLIWGNAVEPEALQNMFMFDVTRSDNGAYTQTATPNGWGYAGTTFNGTGSNWDGNTSIPLGYPCIDQPGRGIGDLLIGAFPSKINDTTGTIAWPNQALEPIYIWKNTGLTPHTGYGGAVYSDQSGGRVLADRDYYEQASGIQTSPTSPFDGTTGVGWGTLANRPITCQPGVAYFVTNEGSWNKSLSNSQGTQLNGADGVLYVATAEDTWELYYTPYTYPHPLRNIFIAESGSAADVQAAMDLATEDGATVIIPAGTFEWESGVAWNMPPNAVLMGAGTSTTGGGDQTVIIDNYEDDEPLIELTFGSVGVVRMRGITFESGSATIGKDGGTVAIVGQNNGTTPAKIRIDHCHFDFRNHANYQGIALWGGFGVMDHCIIDLGQLNAIYTYNGRKGTGDLVGNYEWTLPINFGSDEYFYIEDCIINGHPNEASPYYQTRLIDAMSGSKIILRFNSFDSAAMYDEHGTGHALNDRGAYSMEVYGNSATSPLTQEQPHQAPFSKQTGTGLVFGNAWGTIYKTFYSMHVIRKNSDTYAQIATPGGWGYAGTEFNGTGSMWDGGTALGTDTVLGYPVLDQPGRGPGDLLTGNNPNEKVNAAFGIITWPRQPLVPLYFWSNTGSVVPGWGDNEVSNQGGGRLVENRDYYLPASGIQTSPTEPFDGTEGVGWGTLANRPTTCTPGVAYFAIDQGSWNTSETNPYGVQQNGADGVLYKATAENTWTAYYTPYTYPHPLQGGEEGSSGVINVNIINFSTINIGN